MRFMRRDLFMFLVPSILVFLIFFSFFVTQFSLDDYYATVDGFVGVGSFLDLFSHVVVDVVVGFY